MNPLDSQKSPQLYCTSLVRIVLCMVRRSSSPCCMARWNILGEITMPDVRALRYPGLRASVTKLAMVDWRSWIILNGTSRMLRWRSNYWRPSCVRNSLSKARSSSQMVGGDSGLNLVMVRMRAKKLPSNSFMSARDPILQVW